MRRLRSWPTALRGGLAAMFVVTGGSHFVGMREDLISMVPPALPEPGLLVTVTGVLELAGAAGLLWRPSVAWAAGGLSALLVAMFPANVYAALAGLTLGGAPAMALGPRTLLQLVFLVSRDSARFTFYRIWCLMIGCRWERMRGESCER
jgi:uncharacterized membrane protein